MKNFTIGMWRGLGSFGRVFLLCFLFYFITRIFGKH